MIAAAIDVTAGEAHVVWSHNDEPVSLDASEWATGLREWLRERALHSGGGRVDVLLRNIGTDGHHSDGVVTRLSVNQYGSATATPADDDDWNRTVSPPAEVPVNPNHSQPEVAVRRAADPTPDPEDHDQRRAWGDEVAVESSATPHLEARPTAAASGQAQGQRHSAPQTPGEVAVQDQQISGPEDREKASDGEDQTQNPGAENHSFLTPNRFEEPAQQGWRGVLNHLGLRLSASAREKAQRDDIQAVSQHWPGPRIIVVVNQKGGSTKTPSTILLSAVFALYGGAGVCAWDTNQLQGTLGWRTEQGPHQATAKHLLAEAHRLLGVEAQSADLAHFVHHQTADRYDVLRSQPLMLDAGQRFSPDQVDLVRQVLSKYFRMIIVDTSNDPSDPAWLEIVSRADQLVVATTTVEDRAEAGRLLLDDLRTRGEHYTELASNAVAVVSCADQHASKSQINTIATGYSNLLRDVVTVPYDPAMVSGWLRWSTLQSTTQRAWLRVAAAVARGL